jgi:outer membrane murein-binding lipoprotein Lpp
MNVTRFAARLALGGLLLGGLLLGGCARQQHADAPASNQPAAVTATPDEVDNLLDEVDMELNADSQPLDDQD